MLARALWFVGLLGLVPLFAPRLGVLRVFLVLLAAPLVSDLARWIRRRAWREWDGFLLRYHLCTLLMLLNPFQLAQVLRQAAGQARAARRVGGRPPAPESFRQRVEYRLPFEGEWLVASGGVTPETSHSWELVGQRYAYDFVVADSEGRSHREDGTRPDHYHCYGRPVLAPADGTVTRVRDGVRDAPRAGTGWVDWLSRDFTGNSVTIRHAEGEYSFLAHLAPGSIAVRPGQAVRQGEPLARCGHSGHSTEPHLHFQLQDHPDFFRAASLPVAFSGCRVDGAPAPGPVRPERGARVRHDLEAADSAGPARTAATGG